jgi:hypothetical protein
LHSVKRSNAQTLKRSNAQTLKRSNAQTLKPSNPQTLAITQMPPQPADLGVWLSK